MSAPRHEKIRYKQSVDPTPTDGRDIDTRIGVLPGEAAQQEARPVEQRLQEITPEPWDRVPRFSGEDPTYYERPVLKPSVWSIDIPLYYFVGGAAGAALAMGAAVQVAAGDEGGLRDFSKHCHWIGIAGSTLGAAFLIHDLGRPSRFLNMLRVFRPTSPMNVGAWILSGAAPTAIATALLIHRRAVLGEIGQAMGYASGAFGAALATYTGVLVSNTAI